MRLLKRLTVISLLMLPCCYASAQSANGESIVISENATELGKVDLSGDLQARVKSVAVYGVPSAQPGAATAVPGLTTSQVQVSALGSDHVQVSITYTFQPVIGAVLPSFTGDSVPLNVALTSSVVMRAL